MKTFKLLTFVQISLFLLIGGSLTQKLTFGNKGILEYYKLDEKFSSNQAILKFLNKENKKLETKLSLLNESQVNTLYLEEKAREVLNFGKSDEKLVILENDNY
jgi:cell division protein FtsB